MKIKNILVILTIVLMSCSSYESSFEEKPLTIDGSPSDWNTTLDQKGNSNFTYGISNDSTNLYIRFNTNDQSLQRKIHMAGLNIWIDTTGKKKKAIGIKCPLALNPSNNTKVQKDNHANWGKDKILEAEFIGFKNQSVRSYISNNPFDVDLSICQDEFRSLYYELKIPFSSFNQNYIQLAKTPFSICFEINGIDIPSGPPANGRPSNMSGNRPMGASGGRPNGGQGGGPNGRPDQSMMQDLISTTKLWVKNIQLAPKNTN